MKRLQLGRSIPIRLVLKTVRFFCHVITFADGLSSFNVNTFVKVMTRTYCITLDPKNCNAVLIMSFLCYLVYCINHCVKMLWLNEIRQLIIRIFCTNILCKQLHQLMVCCSRDVVSSADFGLTSPNILTFPVSTLAAHLFFMVHLIAV